VHAWKAADFPSPSCSLWDILTSLLFLFTCRAFGNTIDPTGIWLDVRYRCSIKTSSLRTRRTRPSRLMRSTTQKPDGLGRLGERVANTPCTRCIGSWGGIAVSAVRSAGSNQQSTIKYGWDSISASPAANASSIPMSDSFF
jgi:hypothetical protein